ncbi:MAG: exo-alpha-sialidase [Pirellulales bacterium]
MTQQSLPTRLFQLIAAAAALLAGDSAFAEPSVPIAAKLVRVDRIWSEAPHSAFTDLVWWHDRFYCAFREGQNHVGSQGNLRIISSPDGAKWESMATLEDPVYDLRDANLSIMPDGRLMAVGGAQIVAGKERRTGTFASYSSDGSTWTKPELILPPGRWMWGVTWHNGIAWGVSYGTPDRHGINSLLTSKDGRKFDTYVDKFFAEKEWPTEARIRFAKDGAAVCLQRVDGNPNLAWVGSAAPPYKDWKWSNLERYIGGPNLAQLPSGEWIAAGRLIENKKPRTALLYLDVAKGRATPILDLPSGGDCSYPGLLWHEGRLWMTYYSSHEERTSIYLAQIDITSHEPQN